MSDFSNRYLVPTFNGLIAQIGLSLGISIVCTGFFEWNRRKKTLEYLYSPRCRLSVDPSPPVSLRFMGWVMPTVRMPEEFYINNVGLDAVMFLRFLRMCLQFCIFNGIVVGCILLPIHYHAGGTLTEVPRMSIMNVPNESHLLWAHVFLTYLITVSWMFLLFKNYWQWMDLRREYTLQRIRQGEIAERSVFISRLPSNLRSDASLRQYFESLKMGPVESATVVQHCGRLSQKIDRREGALNMLEKAHIELARSVLASIKAGTFQQTSGPAEAFDDKSANVASTAPVVSYRTNCHDNTDDISKDNKPTSEADNNNNRAATVDYATLQKMAKDLFSDKKRYKKARKSIFAKKRYVRTMDISTKQPDAQEHSKDASPLVKLSSIRSDSIDIVVHPKDIGPKDVEPETQDSRITAPDLVSAPWTVWATLAKVQRQYLDSFQPKKPEKRFKGGPRIHSIDYFVKKYNRLDRKVEELRDGSLRYKSTSFGFVTFKHYLSAQLCAQSKIDSRPQGLSVCLAMEPRDVLWSNLTASFRNRFTRSVAVNLSIWALIVFWIFPTSSFLLLTSLGALSSRFTFLQPVLEASPLIQSLLQNVLPIVFVTIFLALAPVIIVAISKQELPVSYSALEGNVLRRYYHFLIFNVLFVFMIGTAILKSIITLIQKPTNIFTLLAESLPSGSTFFVFYIVFNTCTHFLELVQVWAQLVIHAFVTARKFTQTPRALQRAITPWCFQFYYYYPQNILAMVITLIYSIINPLILLAAVFYFGFALLIFKYQFAYCYIRKYERSGRYFRHVFQYTSDGLIIFQVTMIGVLWLKEAIVGGFFIVALLGMTVYFKMVCGDLFRSRTKFLPLDTGLRSLDSDVLDTCQDEEPRASVSSRSSVRDSNIRKRHSASTGSLGSGMDVEMDRTAPPSPRGVVLEASESKTSNMGQPRTFSRLRVAAGQSDRYRKLLHSDSAEEVSRGNSCELLQTGSLTAAPQGDGSTVEKQEDEYFEHREDKRPRTSVYGNFDSKSAVDDILDDTVPMSTILSEERAEFGDGFMAGNGYFTNPVGPYQPLYVCRDPASHFEHATSRIRYQDRTSEYETYIHPALLKPLNRQLWLPNNPLYDHWDLDDTTEINFALSSSSANEKVVFRTKEVDGVLQSPRSPYDQELRRYAAGSAFDREAGLASHSKAVWEGCLNDSDLVPNSSNDNNNNNNRSRVDGGQGSLGRATTTRPGIPCRSSAIAGPSEQVHKTSRPVPPPLTHSLSLTSVPVLSPDSATAPHFANELVDEPAGLEGGLSRATTRSKRSSSMPPEPILVGGTLANILPPTSPPVSFRLTAAPPRPRVSPLVLPNKTAPGRHLAPPRSLSHGPVPGTPSPVVSFVNEAPKVPSPLAVRSTMFGAPLMHRRGAAPLNHSTSGIGTTTMVGGGSSSHGKASSRGAGGFFNMLFGRYDDDDVHEDAGEKSRFGYETGGMWNNRRGSMDLRDDDDDDDEDEDEDDEEDKNGDQHRDERVQESRLGQGAVDGTRSPCAVSLREGPGDRGGALGLEEMQLAQPSHLDLSDSLSSQVAAVTAPAPVTGRETRPTGNFIQRTMSYLRDSEQA